MENFYVLLAGDRRLSARIEILTSTRCTSAAPIADWRVRRFGYGYWRDPHRKGS